MANQSTKVKLTVNILSIFVIFLIIWLIYSSWKEGIETEAKQSVTNEITADSNKILTEAENEDKDINTRVKSSDKSTLDGMLESLPEVEESAGSTMSNRMGTNTYDTEGQTNSEDTNEQGVSGRTYFERPEEEVVVPTMPKCEEGTLIVYDPASNSFSCL